MEINDNWRMKGDYSKGVTNKKNEFWIGKTTFNVMAHDSIGLKKNLRSGGKNNVTLCIGCRGMKILSQEHVFIVHRIRAETCAMRFDHPQLKLTLLTNEGNEFVYIDLRDRLRTKRCQTMVILISTSLSRSYPSTHLPSFCCVLKNGIGLLSLLAIIGSTSFMWSR